MPVSPIESAERLSADHPARGVDWVSLQSSRTTLTPETARKLGNAVRFEEMASVQAAGRAGRTAYILFLMLHGRSLAKAPSMHARWLGALHGTVAGLLKEIKLIDPTADAFTTSRGLILITERACPHWYLGWLSSKVAETGVPIRGGATRGQVAIERDVDGENVIGRAINDAARLAKWDDNPGCLLLKELAHLFEEDPPPEAWKERAVGLGDETVLVKGKAHEHEGQRARPPFECVSIPDFQTSQVEEFEVDGSAASPALLVCYDLPKFSTRSPEQQVSLFREIVSAVVQTLKLIRLTRGDGQGKDVLFLPGGDGGLIAVLLRPGVEHQVRAEVGQFAERLNDNLRSATGEEVRCSIHGGPIRVWTDARGFPRPGGLAVLEADALTELYPPPLFAVSSWAEQDLPPTIWKLYKQPPLQAELHQQDRIRIPSHYRLIDKAQAAYFFVKGLHGVLESPGASSAAPGLRRFSMLVDSTLRHEWASGAWHAVLDPLFILVTFFWTAQALSGIWTKPDWSIALAGRVFWSESDFASAILLVLVNEKWGWAFIGLVVGLLALVASRWLIRCLTWAVWIVVAVPNASDGRGLQGDAGPASGPPLGYEASLQAWRPPDWAHRLMRRPLVSYVRRLSGGLVLPEMPHARTELAFALLWQHFPVVVLVSSLMLNNVVFLAIWTVLGKGALAGYSTVGPTIGIILGHGLAVAGAFLAYYRLRRIDWSRLRRKEEERVRAHQASQSASRKYAYAGVAMAIIFIVAVVAGVIGLGTGINRIDNIWVRGVPLDLTSADGSGIQSAGVQEQSAAPPGPATAEPRQGAGGSLLMGSGVAVRPQGLQASAWNWVRASGYLLLLPLVSVLLLWLWMRTSRRYERRIAFFAEEARSTADCGAPFVGPHTAKMWEWLNASEEQAATLGILAHVSKEDPRATWVVVDDDDAIITISPEAAASFPGVLTVGAPLVNLLDDQQDVREKLLGALRRSRRKTGAEAVAEPTPSPSAVDALRMKLRDGRTAFFRIVVPTTTEGIRQRRIVLWE